MGRSKHIDRYGKKKLICAVLLAYDPWRKIYNCRICDDKKGCKRNSRSPIVTIQCICGGEKKCGLCRGTDGIKINRCPVSLTRDTDIIRLMPHFYRYKNNGTYPDGRGRIFQPQKLNEALDLMAYVANRKETEQIEMAAKHGR